MNVVIPTTTNNEPCKPKPRVKSSKNISAYNIQDNVEEIAGVVLPSELELLRKLDYVLPVIILDPQLNESREHAIANRKMLSRDRKRNFQARGKLTSIPGFCKSYNCAKREIHSLSHPISGVPLPELTLFWCKTCFAKELLESWKRCYKTPVDIEFTNKTQDQVDIQNKQLHVYLFKGKCNITANADKNQTFTNGNTSYNYSIKEFNLVVSLNCKPRIIVKETVKCYGKTVSGTYSGIMSSFCCESLLWGNPCESLHNDYFAKSAREQIIPIGMKSYLESRDLQRSFTVGKLFWNKYCIACSRKNNKNYLQQKNNKEKEDLKNKISDLQNKLQNLITENTALKISNENLAIQFADCNNKIRENILTELHDRETNIINKEIKLQKQESILFNTNMEFRDHEANFHEREKQIKSQLRELGMQLLKFSDQ